jgi:hypothetical protein
MSAPCPRSGQGLRAAPAALKMYAPSSSGEAPLGTHLVVVGSGEAMKAVAATVIMIRSDTMDKPLCPAILACVLCCMHAGDPQATSKTSRDDTLGRIHRVKDQGGLGVPLGQQSHRCSFRQAVKPDTAKQRHRGRRIRILPFSTTACRRLRSVLWGVWLRSRGCT